MTPINCLAVAALLFQGLDARGRYHTAPLAEYVTLSPSSDRETYHRGQALLLRITAENTSGVPITAYLGLNPRFGDAKVYYRRHGDAQFTELDVLQGKGHSEGPRRKTLNPGKRHSEEVEISLTSYQRGARRFVLDQLGRYEFKVRHTDTSSFDPNGVLESGVLTIEVVEPPALERSAQAAYTPDLAYLAHFGERGGGLPLSPEEKRAAVAFVERFPDSLYTAPVKVGLLRWLWSRKLGRHATEEELRLYETLAGPEEPPPGQHMSVSASTATLWPATNAMLPITVHASVRDRNGDEDPTARITLVSITCDDDCDLASEVSGADFGTDDRAFELRADRGKSGVGRKYAITYSATNAAGHTLTDRTTVTVPPYEVPPPWSAQDVLYEAGAPVTYGGETWRCIGGVRSSPDLAPPVTPGAWVKVPKGKDWDFPVRYAPGDEVTHGGLTFKCREAHISRADSAPPSTPALWARFP